MLVVYVVVVVGGGGGEVVWLNSVYRNKSYLTLENIDFICACMLVVYVVIIGDDGGGGGGGFCSELTFGLFLLIFVSSVLYYLIGIPCNFQNSCNSKNYDICDLTNCHEDNDNNEKVCNIFIIRLNYW